jgi:carboxyl-terminal processing protease
MTNLILSSNTTGKVMFIEHYNNLMQSGEAKILSNQPLFNEDGSYHYIKERVANYGDLDKDYFSEAKQVTYINKKGPLEGITDVVFIVTRSTASASELVINNLKPYINVKIAGTNSYGKPVGFFPITISYKLDAETKKETGYDIYYSMFKITNALAQGDYFDGFKPDLFIDTDDADHDFGDLNENNLARALTLMVPNFSVLSKMSIQGKKKLTAAATVRTILNPNEFIGMIADKPVLKK